MVMRNRHEELSCRPSVLILVRVELHPSEQKVLCPDSRLLVALFGPLCTCALDDWIMRDLLMAQSPPGPDNAHCLGLGTGGYVMCIYQ